MYVWHGIEISAALGESSPKLAFSNCVLVFGYCSRFVVIELVAVEPPDIVMVSARGRLAIHRYVRALEY